MGRGAWLFWLGVALVVADMALLFTAADPLALSRKGAGLLAPLGVICAVASGPLARRGRSA